MALKLVQVTLTGSTPLMFNRQISPAPSKDIDPKKLAAMKLHVDLKGKPCMPKILLMRGFIGGGRYIQYKGVVNFTKGNAPKLTSIVTSCMDIEEEYCPITPSTWELDAQPFNAHSDKAVTRPGDAIRPRFPRGWKISFTLAYDTDDRLITEEKIRAIVETTGKKIGLGSYRVENTGWYGKFTITEWKPMKVGIQKAA